MRQIMNSLRSKYFSKIIEQIDIGLLNELRELGEREEVVVHIMEEFLNMKVWNRLFKENKVEKNAGFH